MRFALLAATAFLSAAALAQPGPQRLPSIALNAGIHVIHAEVGRVIGEAFAG